MQYKDIRKKIQNFPKYNGCKEEPRNSLMNKGFPWTFNLSFGEAYLLQEYGGYVNFDHDYICSAIQSVIRPNDIFDKIIKGVDLWKYLGIFEMSDITGMICFKKAHEYGSIQEFQLSSFMQLLDFFGLDKQKVYPSYSTGGEISALSGGKYQFDFIVPEDKISKELFLKYGILEKNLLKDATRDSFLCLHLNRKTPWGYRNELHYNIGTDKNPKLLDIATFEHFLWLPTFKPDTAEEPGNINGVKKFEHSLHLSVMGVERFAMAINGLDKIQDVDYLQSYFAEVRKIFPELEQNELIAVGELIRVLHRIFSDAKYYQTKITKRQSQYKNKMITVLADKLGGKIDEEKIKPLLEIHAQSQLWHPELKDGVNETLREIGRYLSSYYKTTSSRQNLSAQAV